MVAESRPLPLVPLVIMGLTILAGAAARYWIICNDPLWLDELHTSWVVSEGWSHVADRAAQGHQSPLYFWLVKLIVNGFGQSVGTLRLVSLVSGVALLISVAWVGWRWFRSWAVAWLAVALVAVDETCQFYASEARPYALLQLLAVLHCHWLAAWAWRNDAAAPPIRFWIAVALAACGLVFVHPTAMLLLAAQSSGLIACGAIQRKSGPVCVGLWNVAAAAIGILFIPGSGGTWNARALWSQISDSEALLNGHLLTIMELGAFLAVAAAVLGGLRATAKNHTPSVWLPASSWLGFFALTCCFAIGGDITGWVPLAHERYAVAALACGWLGLAGMVAAIPGPAFRWGAAIAVMAAVLLIPLPRWLDRDLTLQRDNQLVARLTGDSLAGLRMRFEDWRAAVQSINTVNADGQAPVFLRPGLLEEQLPLQPYFDQFTDIDRQRLWQYLEFPVRGIYRLNDRQSVFLQEGNLLDAILSGATTSFDGERLRWVVIDRFGTMPLEGDGTLESIRETVTASLSAGRSLRVRQPAEHFNGSVVRVLYFFEYDDRPSGTP